MSSTPNTRQYGNTTVVPVNVTFTGAALGNVWSAAAGKRITFKGCSLRARVTTALVGATPGDSIFLFDNVVGNPLVNLGVIATATDAPGKDFGQVYFDMDVGYRLAVAANVIKVGSTATITTGVIAINGFVWGIESL